MKTKYTIAIEKGNDHTAYGVLFPDLEGCISAGDSFEEAVANAQEALDFHLESLIKDGVEIPTPKHISEHASNPEYEGLILTTIDTSVNTKSPHSRLLLPLHSILKLIVEHQAMYDPHGPLSYHPRDVYQAELKLLKQINDILDEYESSLNIEADKSSVTADNYNEKDVVEAVNSQSHTAIKLEFSNPNELKNFHEMLLTEYDKYLSKGV